ncbi:MAG: SNF2-related protein, partial [Hydrogenobacter sp.]
VIYQELKKLYDEKKLNKEHLKVLVGLKVDKGLYGLYEVATSENSEEQRIKEFKKSLEIALTSEELDSKELYQQAEFFLKLLEEGYMVLRKTKRPNHAKLYLFKLNEKGAKHSIITGSSNLTKWGLREQEEFNVEIRDYGFEEAERYFDRLWQEAQEISPEDVVKTIRQKTMLRWVEPYTAYAYLVKTYLDLHTPKEFSEEAIKSILEEAGFKPYSYQVHAVMEALSILKDHGGVILADVVGLGKTVIACAIAKLLGLKGIVIAPPHLLGDEEDRGWRYYLSRFGLYDWKPFSIGKLESALEFINKNPHYQAVIVDEAHRFRNEETQSYELLKAITTHRKVLLLTATPFNNRPEDIFAMLKLFTLPKRSTIVLDGDLQEKFRKLQRDFEDLSYIKKHYYSQDIKKKKQAIQKYENLFGSKEVDIYKVDLRLKSTAQKIKGMISPVVIRRNRLDLRWYKEEIALSQVKDPIVKFYKLSEDQSKFYDEVIQTFSSPEEGGKFVGALYMPERYLKGEQKDNFRELSQRNLYDFMRRLLVKRFESSFYAFNQSIQNFIQLHEIAIEFVQKSRKYVLNRDLIEDLYTAEEETILKELKEFEDSLKASSSPKGRYEYIYDETNTDIDKLLEDLKRDKKLFEDIQKKLERSGLLQQDPKLQELSNTLREFIQQNRK